MAINNLSQALARIQELILTAGRRTSAVDMRTVLSEISEWIDTKGSGGDVRPTAATFQSEQTFDVYYKQKLDVVLSSNISFTLASSGNVANSYIEYVINPNGFTPTFPSNWIIKGEGWNILKMIRLLLYYDGVRVEVVRTQLEDVPDITAPTLINPNITNIAETTATFEIDTNENQTTVYWGVYLTADGQHSKSEILAGTDAIDFGSVTGDTGTLQAIMNSMVAETAYKVHYYGEDTDNNETDAAMSSEFTTSTGISIWANTVGVSLSNDGKDITKTASQEWGNAVGISSVEVTTEVVFQLNNQFDIFGIGATEPAQTVPQTYSMLVNGVQIDSPNVGVFNSGGTPTDYNKSAALGDYIRYTISGSDLIIEHSSDDVTYSSVTTLNGIISGTQYILFTFNRLTGTANKVIRWS